MSEKKKKQDNHKSGFLVRLPEEYRELLQELKNKTGQPFTFAITRATDAYLKANGIARRSPSGK